MLIVNSRAFTTKPEMWAYVIARCHHRRYYLIIYIANVDANADADADANADANVDVDADSDTIFGDC